MDSNRSRVYWHADSPNTANKVQRVKNLGWLLAHASEVDTLTISRLQDGARLSADGTRNGRHFTYITDFGSYIVCRQFVARPCLIHARLIKVG